MCDTKTEAQFKAVACRARLRTKRVSVPCVIGASAGCIFSNLGGNRSAVYTNATPLSFDGCTFDNNMAERSNNSIAVVSAGGAAARVLLQGSLFGDSNSLLLRSAAGAEIFSDDAALKCASAFKIQNFRI